MGGDHKPPQILVDIDTSVAHSASPYDDYHLGGQDNFKVDHKAGQAFQAPKVRWRRRRKPGPFGIMISI